MKKQKVNITQQGLESSLIAMLEYGYKACERGLNIQAAIFEASPAVKRLVETSGLEKEVFRIMTLGDKYNG